MDCSACWFELNDPIACRAVVRFGLHFGLGIFVGSRHGSDLSVQIRVFCCVMPDMYGVWVWVFLLVTIGDVSELCMIN